MNNKINKIIFLALFFIILAGTSTAEEYDFSKGEISAFGTTFSGRGLSLDQNGNFAMQNGIGNVGVFSLSGDFLGKASEGIITGNVDSSGLTINNDFIPQGSEVEMNAKTGEYKIISSSGIKGIKIDNNQINLEKDVSLLKKSDGSYKVESKDDYANAEIKDNQGRIARISNGNVYFVNEIPKPEQINAQGNSIYLNKGFLIHGIGIIFVPSKAGYNVYDSVIESTNIWTSDGVNINIENNEYLGEIARTKHHVIIKDPTGKTTKFLMTLRYMRESTKDGTITYSTQGSYFVPENIITKGLLESSSLEQAPGIIIMIRNSEKLDLLGQNDIVLDNIKIFAPQYKVERELTLLESKKLDDKSVRVKMSYDIKAYTKIGKTKAASLDIVSTFNRDISDNVLMTNGIINKKGEPDYERLFKKNSDLSKDVQSNVISEIADKGGLNIKLQPKYTPSPSVKIAAALARVGEAEVIEGTQDAFYSYGDKFDLRGNDLREWENAVRNMEPKTIMTFDFQKDGIILTTENPRTKKPTTGRLSKTASDKILNEFR